MEAAKERTIPDGSYANKGLPSGNHRVQATVSEHVAEYYNNAPDEASAAEVWVNAPGDTSGIDFSVSPSQVAAHGVATQGEASNVGGSSLYECPESLAVGLF